MIYGYKFNLVNKIIQVRDSIPWVRCASGNVLFITRITSVQSNLQSPSIGNWKVCKYPNEIGIVMISSLQWVKLVMMTMVTMAGKWLVFYIDQANSKGWVSPQPISLFSFYLIYMGHMKYLKYLIHLICMIYLISWYISDSHKNLYVRA